MTANTTKTLQELCAEYNAQVKERCPDALLADKLIHALTAELDKRGWQPMSSAPKDGTVILGYYGLTPDDDDYHTVMYMPDWHGKGKGAWRASFDNPKYTDWSEPRAWMPLPAPPKLTKSINQAVKE